MAEGRPKRRYVIDFASDESLATAAWTVFIITETSLALRSAANYEWGFKINRERERSVRTRSALDTRTSRQEVKYVDRLGLGSLVQKAAVAARYPHWRRPWQGRDPALPSQQNRGIH